MWEKSKRITQYDKKTVTCDKNIVDAMLVLLNMTMEPSNLRKKIKEPPNMIRERSHVMLELHNVRMELSNMRKK